MLSSQILNYFAVVSIIYRVGMRKMFSWFLISVVIFLVSVLQSQLPPDVESVLLQQVLNLTPEQLSLLPPEQQQQVLQLQQVLRRDQVQI